MMSTPLTYLPSDDSNSSPRHRQPSTAGEHALTVRERPHRPVAVTVQRICELHDEMVEDYYRFHHEINLDAWRGLAGTEETVR